MEMILTETEQKRKEQHKAICARYAKLTSAYPDAKPSRLFFAIAKEFGMTLSGVRRILIENKQYELRREKA